MQAPRFKSWIFRVLLKAPPRGRVEDGRSFLQRRFTPGPEEVKCSSVAEHLQTSDLILMILDATKKAEQRALIEAELEAVGIRLNREAPYVMLHRVQCTLSLTRVIAETSISRSRKLVG